MKQTAAQRQKARRDKVKKQGFSFKTICVHDADLEKFSEFMQTLMKPMNEGKPDV